MGFKKISEREKQKLCKRQPISFIKFIDCISHLLEKLICADQNPSKFRKNNDIFKLTFLSVCDTKHRIS